MVWCHDLRGVRGEEKGKGEGKRGQKGVDVDSGTRGAEEDVTTRGLAVSRRARSHAGQIVPVCDTCHLETRQHV